MQEIQTKILDVDPEHIKKMLDFMCSKRILETKFDVNWFRLKDSSGGEEPWFLRIRTATDGFSEVTWKSKADRVGISKQSKELRFNITDPKIVAETFEAIGLEKYAHQEKSRISWQFKNWHFDLDQYPSVPAYLEIKGLDLDSLHEAIETLQLKNHQASSDGERDLILSYGVDWYNMSFKS